MKARAVPFVLLLALAGSEGCICSGNHIVCSQVAINDPSNRTMRRSIMSYGLGEFCKQMTIRNAPLKLSDDQPVIGRFYPRGCASKELENGDLTVQFDGVGYAWTAPTKKMTFSAGASVQYNQDFECDDNNAIYAHFPVRAVSPPSFQMGTIEQPITSLLQGMMPQLSSQFGQQILRTKLVDGLTVISEDGGNTDFGIGIFHPPTRPPHPFNVPSGSRITYENLRVEVHPNERDFIGPIYVEDSGKALYITMGLDGAQAADIFVMSGDEGAASLADYLGAAQAGPLRFPLRPPPFTGVLQAGMQYLQTVQVSSGYWYVVIDNTPTAGIVNPPQSLFDAPPAVVNYVIQIGDAP